MANVIYNNFFTKLAAGEIDLDNDEIRCALYREGSDCITAAKSLYGDLTIANETAEAYGYIRGGQALAGKIVELQKFAATDIAWTATGGNIIARYAVLYRYHATNPKYLICCLDLGSEKTAVPPAAFKVQFHTSGIITFAQVS